MNILIVEDDPRVASFIARGLQAEGYATCIERDGGGALARVRSESFGLILLDVMLPVMTGIELTQTIRAERNSVPILMLTAMGAIKDRVEGLRCGADDYLTKPFAFDELLARIEALRRRPRDLAAPEDILSHADLRFDRQRMAVKRGSQAITLSAKELALLELLMTSEGRIISRERILSNVWGSQEDPLTNIVDVYIRRLRAKIDEGREVSLIQTVRGLGYRMGA
jgi:DNA-binding response OmpR family regulator